MKRTSVEMGNAKTQKGASGADAVRVTPTMAEKEPSAQVSDSKLDCSLSVEHTLWLLWPHNKPLLLFSPCPQQNVLVLDTHLHTHACHCFRPSLAAVVFCFCAAVPFSPLLLFFCVDSSDNLLWDNFQSGLWIWSAELKLCSVHCRTEVWCLQC